MMIQEFHPTEMNKCSIWNSGLNLGKKIALTGIVLSAAPLVLPPLAVLSAFGFAFAVPFGFYLASYAVTDKLMSTLLSKPKPPPPPLYENVSGDDEKNALKAKEEWVVYDSCQVLDVSVEFDREGNNEIQDDGLKDMGEVIDDMYEQDGYEEDMENDVAYEILEGIREAEEEMLSVVLSAEIGWENDTVPRVSMEELERETAGMIASMEKSLEEMDDDLVRLRNGRGSLEGKELVSTIASEILKGVREAKEEMIGNDVEAVVVSVEVGGENDINVDQVEEVPKVKLGDIEPGELERETTGKIESKEFQEEIDECVRKLVVHTKKPPGDENATRIREETESSPRGKILIVMYPDTRGTAKESGLGLLGQDHPEGIDHNSFDIQDANLNDHEVPNLARASTSKPIEGLNNEDSIWKRIKAMRAIVGYEAPQHESSVEELKALYVFTGVEPPASFSEPFSVADVTEKLQFLMEIVGVKI